MFKELYQYRELLKSSVQKEIRGKYKASMLGVLWSFINPLLQVLVYAIVFPYLLRNTGDNYLVYLVTGIIPWNFFTTVITGTVNCIKVNAGIIKKVYFPRIVLPVSIAVSGLINFFISCLIVIAVCIFSGVGVSWHIILLPVIAIVQMIFSLGIGLVLSACDAYVQDLEYMVNFLIQLAMYGTPIVYNLNVFSNTSNLLVQLIRMNPLTIIVGAYRDIFLYHQMFDLPQFGVVAIIALVILCIGTMVFHKLEKGFAEQF